MSSHYYPQQGGGGSAYWGDAVANLAALPASGSVVGEVRLVLDTDELYEWNGSSWQKILSASTVLGPASATDNAIARFDGTTGKLIQNSTATLADTGEITSASLTASRVLISGSTKEIQSSSVTTTTLGYLDATSSIQTQLDGKEPTITVLPVSKGGTNSGAALNNNRAIISSAGSIVESATTSTEVGYLSGVTSAIQTQLDAKVDLAGDTMTGLLVLSGDPAVALGAATKQYVDSVANGIQWKASVRAASTANVDRNNGLENGDTIDGVTLATGDRVLLKNQSSADQNGIYVVVASGAASRSADADAFGELNGACVFVREGTANADKGFIQTAELTSLSDNQTWVQNFGTGLYTADGQGIELSGSTFSLELDGTTLSKSSSGLKVADLGIANAQVSASAGITRSKLAAGTVNRLAYNDGSTGALSDLAAITASRAIISDANGLPTHATTTSTEIGYVNGVTSAIQTQLDAKLCATSVAAVSSDVTLTNKRIHLVDTSSARSLTLPSATSGAYIVVKDKTGSAQTNNITLVRAASEKIETVAASFTLDSNLGSWTIVSDGTDWFII